MKKKTKSKHDIIDQLARMHKTFYSIHNYCEEPYISQMTLASAIAEQYHENINYYLGDYNLNDSKEFHRRYDLQMPKEIYAKYSSVYLDYLIKKMGKTTINKVFS